MKAFLGVNLVIDNCACTFWCFTMYQILAYLKIWLNLKQIATDFIFMVSCTLIISK